MTLLKFYKVHIITFEFFSTFVSVLGASSVFTASGQELEKRNLNSKLQTRRAPNEPNADSKLISSQSRLVVTERKRS